MASPGRVVHADDQMHFSCFAAGQTTLTTFLHENVLSSAAAVFEEANPGTSRAAFSLDDVSV